MNRNRLIIAIISFLVLSGLTYVGIVRFVAANRTPDSSDSQAIHDVIYYSYAVCRGALQNGGDVTEFDDVFVNSNDYQYENDEAREFVELVLGSDVAEKGGYLTAIKAKYIAFGCGVKILKEVEQTARKENRKVTSDDVRWVSEQCYGIIPPSVVENGSPRKLEFKSILINDDTATARYDDGAALLEANLRKINGQWLISNIKPLEVHF